MQPVYQSLFGFEVFGLGFVTSMVFIFVTGRLPAAGGSSCSRQTSDSKLYAGAFASSWLGGLALQLGEWIIKKLPLVKHIYSAAKQERVCKLSPLLDRVQTAGKCCRSAGP